MGCARFLREQGHPAKIIAVDSIGSVTFGGRPGPAFPAGLGTSRRPEIVDESLLDDVVMQDERSAVQMCHRLARHGFLFGGSTGSVLSAAERYLAGQPENLTAVAISPDLGDRYLDTLYDPAWVDGGSPAALAGAEPRTPSPRCCSIGCRGSHRTAARCRGTHGSPPLRWMRMTSREPPGTGRDALADRPAERRQDDHREGARGAAARRQATTSRSSTAPSSGRPSAATSASPGPTGTPTSTASGGWRSCSRATA